ncbi:MAG: HAD family phosphatase [Prevotella sp.]|nr:HAD family phosphatase [Prevotella sp.]
MIKIKNIVFDFGGVIVTLDHKQAVKKFKALGLKDAVSQLDPYTQGGIFGDLEMGKISAQQFVEQLSVLCGRQLSYKACSEAWLAYRKDVPKRNLKALLRLREEGYRLILLSNTNPFMMEWAESGDFDGQGHQVGHYFDAVYASYREGVMKPDPMFFRRVLLQEGILAEETLFVDDGPRNVAAASQLGIATFCPVNGKDWTQEIYKYIDANSYVFAV